MGDHADSKEWGLMTAVLRFILLLALVPYTALAQDSIRVESLLRAGAQQGRDANLVVFYAERLVGVPYVARTLEVNKTERLVVNLRGLDCTTYVETCLALALTTRQGSVSYADYCQWLTKLRYRQGILDGYASRNHYFTQWIRSNEEQGLVEEISVPQSLFSAKHTISLHYMSDHPDQYPMMRNDAESQKLIRRHEREDSGREVRYIPRSGLNAGQDSTLGIIEDGDILAIVSGKDGLDTSHLGIAKWGADGRLHLLNASQIHKKVVLEPMTLYEYMGKHPSQLGIRVIRLK